MVNKRNQGSSHDSSFRIGSCLIRNQGKNHAKRQMKNKKAWIRIVEALIAILLIMGFLILILNSQAGESKSISSKVYSAENAILREIQLNSTYRTYILTINNFVEFDFFYPDLRTHITKRIPEYLECTSKICDFATDSVCDISSLEGNIYVRSVMIAGDSTTYEPKLLKMFCWTQ